MRFGISKEFKTLRSIGPTRDKLASVSRDSNSVKLVDWKTGKVLYIGLLYKETSES